LIPENRRYKMKNRTKNYFLIIAVTILTVLFVLILTDNIGIYNELNKGIYFLNCGFEFIGNPGFFCG
jgi:hypothetical protein